MDGLTRIIEKIEAESAQRCAEVIAQAEKKAQEIAESTKADLERQYAEADAASDEAAKAVVVRALASVQQQKKQAILKAKMQVINDAIAQAEQAFLAMPDKEYFVALSALIKANAQPGEGVLHLNERDLRRAPGSFLSKLGEIKLCKDPADIRVLCIALPDTGEKKIHDLGADALIPEPLVIILPRFQNLGKCPLVRVVRLHAEQLINGFRLEP